MYNDLRDKVCAELNSVEYFATTTDLWSSDNMIPYLGLTVHFIDNSWKLQSRVLETLYFPQDHTAENIAETLKEVFSTWGLSEDKHVCMTTDNGSNIKKALKELSWLNLSCFGHNLHLAINASLNDSRVTRTVGVCRTIVSTFTVSWKKRRDLKEAQETLSLPKHQLITDCATRWGAKHAMIKRILEQESGIRRVLSSDRKTAHLTLTWQDSQVLEAVCSALDCVGDYTDILSQEKYVSVSSLKPLISLLNGDLLSTSEDTHALTSKMKDTIKTSLTKRYQDINISELLSLATFCDPKFKARYLSSEEIDSVKSKILTEEHLHSLSVVTDKSAVQTPVKKTLASLFSQPSTSLSDSITNTMPIANRINAEIDSYIAATDPDQDSNPLDWWRTHEKTFPTLANFARKYLCATATSCPSERLFSKSGQIVTPKRACLKPEKVNMLSFLAANMSSFVNK